MLTWKGEAIGADTSIDKQFTKLSEACESSVHGK